MDSITTITLKIKKHLRQQTYPGISHIDLYKVVLWIFSYAFGFTETELLPTLAEKEQ